MSPTNKFEHQPNLFWKKIEIILLHRLSSSSKGDCEGTLPYHIGETDKCVSRQECIIFWVCFPNDHLILTHNL